MPGNTRLRRATLAYARPESARPIASLPLELLQPASGITLGVCLFLAAGLHVLLLGVVGGGVPLVVVVLALKLVLVSHYVNVLDDFGPRGFDVVPPVLRNGELGEDVFVPARRGGLSLLLCLGPAFLLAWLGLPVVLWLTVGMIGFAFLPAVLLTVVEASTPLNLMPHRLVGLIRVCGRDYALALALLVAAVVAHVVAAVAMAESIQSIFGRSLIRPAAPLPVSTAQALTYGVVAVAIFVGHLALAAIGRLHRLHSERFPWLMQVHVKQKRPARSNSRSTRPVTL